jgi:hypothetical protein
MSKRLALLGLGALLLTLNSGCCLVNCINCWHDRYLAHYQATHFNDCGCGERFWNNWYNSPPLCCDPCDQWGNFTGRKWWVPNCMSCRGGGCGDCGPGTCPGISPAGRMYNPGGGSVMEDGMPSNTETVTPAEEVPVPYQSSRGNMRGYQPGPRGYQQGPYSYQSGPQGYQPGPNGYQQGPNGYQQGPNGYQQGPNGYQQGPMRNGPSRMSRQPRYVQPPDPRVTQRQVPRAEADIVPAEYQSDGPFYDDAQVTQAGGYRVSTSTANYRR